MSEQTCSSEGYLPIESGGDRMHQGWDQPAKQEQRETPQAFLGMPPYLKNNKNVSKGEEKEEFLSPKRNV